MLSWTSGQSASTADKDEQDYLNSLLADSPPSPKAPTRKQERVAAPSDIRKNVRPDDKSASISERTADPNVSTKTSLHFDLSEVTKQGNSNISYSSSFSDTPLVSLGSDSLSSFVSPIAVDDTATFASLYTGVTQNSTLTAPSPSSSQPIPPRSPTASTSIADANNPHTHADTHYNQISSSTAISSTAPHASLIRTSPSTEYLLPAFSYSLPSHSVTASPTPSTHLLAFASHPLFSHAAAATSATTTATTALLASQQRAVRKPQIQAAPYHTAPLHTPLHSFASTTAPILAQTHTHARTHAQVQAQRQTPVRAYATDASDVRHRQEPLHRALFATALSSTSTVATLGSASTATSTLRGDQQTPQKTLGKNMALMESHLGAEVGAHTSTGTGTGTGMGTGTSTGTSTGSLLHTQILRHRARSLITHPAAAQATALAHVYSRYRTQLSAALTHVRAYVQSVRHIQTTAKTTKTHTTVLLQACDELTSRQSEALTAVQRADMFISFMKIPEMVQNSLQTIEKIPIFTPSRLPPVGNAEDLVSSGASKAAGSGHSLLHILHSQAPLKPAFIDWSGELTSSLRLLYICLLFFRTHGYLPDANKVVERCGAALMQWLRLCHRLFHDYIKASVHVGGVVAEAGRLYRDTPLSRLPPNVPHATNTSTFSSSSSSSSFSFSPASSLASTSASHALPSALPPHLHPSHTWALQPCASVASHLTDAIRAQAHTTCAHEDGVGGLGGVGGVEEPEMSAGGLRSAGMAAGGSVRGVDGNRSGAEEILLCATHIPENRTDMLNSEPLLFPVSDRGYELWYDVCARMRPVLYAMELFAYHGLHMNPRLHPHLLELPASGREKTHRKRYNRKSNRKNSQKDQFSEIDTETDQTDAAEMTDGNFGYISSDIENSQSRNIFGKNGVYSPEMMEKPMKEDDLSRLVLPLPYQKQLRKLQTALHTTYVTFRKSQISEDLQKYFRNSGQLVKFGFPADLVDVREAVAVEAALNGTGICELPYPFGLSSGLSHLHSSSHTSPSATSPPPHTLALSSPLPLHIWVYTQVTTLLTVLCREYMACAQTFSVDLYRNEGLLKATNTAVDSAWTAKYAYFDAAHARTSDGASAVAIDTRTLESTQVPVVENEKPKQKKAKEKERQATENAKNTTSTPTLLSLHPNDPHLQAAAEMGPVYTRRPLVVPVDAATQLVGGLEDVWYGLTNTVSETFASLLGDLDVFVVSPQGLDANSVMNSCTKSGSDGHAASIPGTGTVSGSGGGSGTPHNGAALVASLCRLLGCKELPPTSTSTSLSSSTAQAPVAAYLRSLPPLAAVLALPGLTAAATHLGKCVTLYNTLTTLQYLYRCLAHRAERAGLAGQLLDLDALQSREAGAAVSLQSLPLMLPLLCVKRMVDMVKAKSEASLIACMSSYTAVVQEYMQAFKLVPFAATTLDDNQACNNFTRHALKLCTNGVNTDTLALALQRHIVPSNTTRAGAHGQAGASLAVEASTAAKDYSPVHASLATHVQSPMALLEALAVPVAGLTAADAYVSVAASATQRLILRVDDAAQTLVSGHRDIGSGSGGGDDVGVGVGAGLALAPASTSTSTSTSISASASASASHSEKADVALQLSHPTSSHALSLLSSLTARTSSLALHTSGVLASHLSIGPLTPCLLLLSLFGPVLSPPQRTQLWVAVQPSLARLVEATMSTLATTSSSSASAAASRRDSSSSLAASNSNSTFTSTSTSTAAGTSVAAASPYTSPSLTFQLTPTLLRAPSASTVRHAAMRMIENSHSHPESSGFPDVDRPEESLPVVITQAFSSRSHAPSLFSHATTDTHGLPSPAPPLRHVDGHVSPSVSSSPSPSPSVSSPYASEKHAHIGPSLLGKRLSPFQNESRIMLSPPAESGWMLVSPTYTLPNNPSLFGYGYLRTPLLRFKNGYIHLLQSFSGTFFRNCMHLSQLLLLSQVCTKHGYANITNNAQYQVFIDMVNPLWHDLAVSPVPVLTMATNTGFGWSTLMSLVKTSDVSTKTTVFTYIKPLSQWIYASLFQYVLSPASDIGMGNHAAVQALRKLSKDAHVDTVTSAAPFSPSSLSSPSSTSTSTSAPATGTGNGATSTIPSLFVLLQVLSSPFQKKLLPESHLDATLYSSGPSALLDVLHVCVEHLCASVQVCFVKPLESLPVVVDMTSASASASVEGGRRGDSGSGNGNGVKSNISLIVPEYETRVVSTYECKLHNVLVVLASYFHDEDVFYTYTMNMKESLNNILHQLVQLLMRMTGNLTLMKMRSDAPALVQKLIVMVENLVDITTSQFQNI